MKQSILSLTILLLGSTMAQAHSPSTLSGTYQVKSNACETFLKIGDQVKIDATATSLNYVLVINDPSISPGPAYQSIFEGIVGTYTTNPAGCAMCDGIAIKSTGAYSNNGSEYNYSEVWLANGGSQPSDETTKLVRISKQGYQIKLQNGPTSSSGLGPACILE